MDHTRLREWVDGYERAWRTPGTEILAELFTDDATYSTAPFENPYRGLAAIAELWEAEREGPGEAFTMESEIVAVEDEVGVARIEVRYGDPVRRTYRDIWIVRFAADGRCVAFEEWPFWPEEGQAAHAAGPG